MTCDLGMVVLVTVGLPLAMCGGAAIVLWACYKVFGGN